MRIFSYTVYALRQCNRLVLPITPVARTRTYLPINETTFNNYVPKHPSLMQVTSNNTLGVPLFSNNFICFNNVFENTRKFSTKSSSSGQADYDEKNAKPTLPQKDLSEESSKLNLLAKFKLMYKKYWYVLIPVHVITSFGWLVGFYYLSKSGVDLPALLQCIHLSETIIDKVQNSDMGHYAISYVCYKVATPVRYAVTLGGTTISIKYLEQKGYIRPVPTKKQIIQMYEQKKVDRAKAKEAKRDKSS